MKVIHKLALLEFIGGLFGWIWMGAGIAALYFFVVAIGFDGQWSKFFWAFGISVVSKSLLRGFMETQYRVQNTAELGEQNQTSEDSDNVLGKIEKVVQSYGAVMEKTAGMPGTVYDVSLLPYPKETIKESILMMQKLVDDEEIKKALDTAYYSLADFQEGVGDNIVGFDTFALSKAKEPDEVITEFENNSGGWKKKLLELQAKELKSLYEEASMECYK